VVLLQQVDGDAVESFVVDDEDLVGVLEKLVEPDPVSELCFS